MPSVGLRAGHKVEQKSEYCGLCTAEVKAAICSHAFSNYKKYLARCGRDSSFLHGMTFSLQSIALIFWAVGGETDFRVEGREVAV